MSAPDYTPEFEAFWKAYPRRTAKVTAFKAWQKQIGDGDLFDETWKRVVADCEKRTRMNWWPADKSKIPHGATWVNQRRWEDEGWEEDVRTRGKEHEGAAYVPRPPTPDDTPRLSWGETLLGRLWFAYIVGTRNPVETCRDGLTVRATFLRDWVPAFQEDIDAGKTTIAKASAEIAGLFIKALDEAYGRDSHDVVMAHARRQDWGRAE